MTRDPVFEEFDPVVGALSAKMEINCCHAL